MKSLLKKIVQRTLRFLLKPVSINYQKRNGIQSNQERKELPNEVLLSLASEALQRGSEVTIFVKGYSMRPFIEHERDRVRLRKNNTLQVGDAVLAELSPGHYVLHRIIQIKGEHVTLQGDGNVCGTEHCLRSDVCGTVVEYIRPSRTISADDACLVRRIRLWRTLLPIRRYLLFIYQNIV